MKIEGPYSSQPYSAKPVESTPKRDVSSSSGIRNNDVAVSYNKELGRDVIQISRDGAVVEQIPSEKEIEFLTHFRALLDTMFKKE